MNRLHEQEEYWNLGHSSVMNVKYKFNNIRKDNDSLDKITIINIEPECNKKPPKFKKVNLQDKKNNLKPNDMQTINNSNNSNKNFQNNSNPILSNDNSNSLSANNLNNTNNLTTLEYELFDTGLINLDKVDRDFFCEGFFIAGLSRKSKVIAGSEHLVPHCKHKVCGKLPAYKPEVLGEFLAPRGDIDSKFALTQLTTNLCFPNSIKVCYCYEGDYSDTNTNINTNTSLQKNFMTVTTNEAGKRHYIYVYNYYHKISLLDFKNTYEFDPVTDHNRLNKRLQSILTILSSDGNTSKEITKCEREYEENFLMCCELAARDYIYLPSCACLVSKFPFSKQIEKSIEVIMKMTIDENFTTEEINRFLFNLIFEIPIPPNNTRLLFYIPYIAYPLEITGKLFKDLPICYSNITILFEFFQPEIIVQIYYLILFEQKILFIYDDYNKLTEISQSFLNLIYPMQWIHTYIPILSEDMVKYIKSFMPFIMGIETSIFSYFFSKLDEFELDDDNNIFFIFISKKSTIESFSASKKTFIKNISTRFNHIMPDEVSIDVVKELESLISFEKDSIKKKSQYSNGSLYGSSYDILSPIHANKYEKKIQKKLRNIFIKSLALLIGDYKKYVSYIDNSFYFNSESFISSRDEKYKNFYQELTQTGIFRNFLHMDSTENFYFDKLCSRYINSILCISNKKNKKLKIRKPSIMNSDSKLKAKIKRSESYSSNDLKIRRSSINMNADVYKKGIDQINLDSVTNLNSTRNFVISDEFNSENNFQEEKISKKGFIILPYFLNTQIKSVIPIEEIILEKFKRSNKEMEEIIEKKIFPLKCQKEFNFDFKYIPSKFRSYLIPNNGIESFKFNKIKSFYTNSKNDTIEHEMINDFLKGIITTESYSKIDNATITKVLTTKSGRNHFSTILYQSKFNENKTQILNEKGFEDLFHMIFSCLVTCENDSSFFDDVMRITKSSFFYYKLVKSKHQVYVYQEILNKLHTIDIWLNEDFWIRWFHSEKDLKENTFLNSEDFYFFILSEMATLMNNLKIDLNFILLCIIQRIAFDILKNDANLIQDLEKTIKKQNEYFLREND